MRQPLALFCFFGVLSPLPFPAATKQDSAAGILFRKNSLNQYLINYIMIMLSQKEKVFLPSVIPDFNPFGLGIIGVNDATDKKV